MNTIPITRQHVQNIYLLVKDVCEKIACEHTPTILASLQEHLMNITGVDPTSVSEETTIVDQAKELAYAKHAFQIYGRENSSVPYVRHLEMVVDVLKRFGFNETKYIVAAYLHDIIEDTNTSYNDLQHQFGEVIADIVYCVTDEIGKNRKDRKAKTYTKIASNQDALVIKLADRIANIEYGLETKSTLVKMYIKEHDDFEKSLRNPCDFSLEVMWNHISLLLKGAEYK